MKKQQLTKSAKTAAALTVGMTLALGATGVAQASASPRGHDANNGHGSAPWHNPQNDRDSHKGAGAVQNLRGVISAVSSTSITIQGEAATPIVLAITPATTVFEGSTSATPSILAVGQSVSVALSTSATNTAAKITVQVAKIQGTVASLSGNTIVLNSHDGFSRTVDVTSTTVYSEGGVATTLSAVLIGSTISASGIVGPSQTTLNALSITISAPKDVRGTLSAVSPTSITVAGPGASSTVLALTSTTAVYAGSIVTSASSLAIGQRVAVTLSATSAATASKVTIDLVTLKGTVSAVGASTITLAEPQGFVRVINVTSATKYVEGATTVALSAVAVGSKVSAQGVVATDQTSLNALSVSISAPSDVHGVVTAVSATLFTVLAHDNTSTIFSIGASTTVLEGRLAATSSALAIGQHVDVARLAAAPTVATKVTIDLVTVEGQVTAVGSSTITVAGHQGFVRVIDVSSATKYVEGTTTVALSAVTVGSKVIAQGVVASDQTSLNALTVSVAQAK